MVDTPRRGPSDAADYSSTKAPETRQQAEERHPHPDDSRLQPGGPHGVSRDPGMSSLDRADAVSGGCTPQKADGEPDDPAMELREIYKMQGRATK